MTASDMPIHSAGDPHTVTCPNCAAQPGQPCTQPTDTGRRNVTWHHLAREAAVSGA